MVGWLPGPHLWDVRQFAHKRWRNPISFEMCCAFFFFGTSRRPFEYVFGHTFIMESLVDLGGKPRIGTKNLVSCLRDSRHLVQLLHVIAPFFSSDLLILRTALYSEMHNRNPTKQQRTNQLSRRMTINEMRPFKFFVRTRQRPNGVIRQQ